MSGNKRAFIYPDYYNSSEKFDFEENIRTFFNLSEL
jgi:hypothetical protein